MHSETTKYSSKIKMVIIDDDPGSRKLLQKLLKKHPQVSIVGEADSIQTALNVINKEAPDTLFLDIKLNNENGFDLIKRMHRKANVVFVSGYDGYALKAFEMDALDYLKKPINSKRLDLTVKRLLNKNEITEQQTNHNHDLLEDVEDAIPESSVQLFTKFLGLEDRIFVTTKIYLMEMPEPLQMSRRYASKLRERFK